MTEQEHDRVIATGMRTMFISGLAIGLAVGNLVWVILRAVTR